MAFKDYYAILMVHPQAEAFVIEAAYKRLAREYHPDLRTNVGNPRHQHDQHEKMLEINEAYEVLSNPNRRKSFDQDYTRYLNRPQPQTGNTTTNQPATHTQDARWGSVGPTFPEPGAYGIDADYLARAHAGAQEWLRREDRIPARAKWLTRLLSSFVGLMISLWMFRTTDWKLAAFFVWVASPVLAEMILRLIETIRDRHLQRYKFNPLYNPNPVGFRAYAAALAQYEVDTMRVFVAREAIYHENKACPKLNSYEPLPRWFARFRGAKPCAHCCQEKVATLQQLPPPFGKGKLKE